jgi:glutaredoxin-like protein NrdH
MTVTVYTAPGCYGCSATKRQLDKAGIPYVEEPMSADVVDEAKATLGEKLMAPIVRAGEHLWAGFRPDRINALAGIVA